ncbi:outer membrane protein with beta-barrel domain [Chitinophaga niastensis]|uniref:Outer membrane protein with beta-barrel domain n=1 Tax=Chitinophaga niastensis TaxID=536980 RepID=A0A2P8HKB7_CHINA|nr:porin family protein [Chitinophaga niastensis]PSL46661.1 outer membrane protein with beta-barrel domain [Chitinophaga niastensis]
MKKLILSGVLAIGTMLAVQAQNVTFGVKGGLNLMKLTNFDGHKTRASFNIGGLVNIELDKSWAIQPELLYSGQGTKYSKSILWGAINTSGTLKTDYINIPVMVQYTIVPSFYLEAGPQVGILAGAKWKAGDNSTDIKSDMRSTDFGLNFGFGYKTDMGLGFGGRYNFGLTNVFNTDKFNHDSKNSGAQIDVFYIF